MSWKPRMTDLPHPIPTDHLLKDAVHKMAMKGIISFPMERLTDSYGMYGIRYKQYLVVAKKEPYGNIVSVHEEAVLKAQLHRVYIIMYLASAKAFYQFDPEEVFKKGTRNYKGFAPMINFPIRMGRRTDWA